MSIKTKAVNKKVTLILLALWMFLLLGQLAHCIEQDVDGNFILNREEMEIMRTKLKLNEIYKTELEAGQDAQKRLVISLDQVGREKMVIKTVLENLQTAFERIKKQRNIIIWIAIGEAIIGALTVFIVSAIGGN